MLQINETEWEWDKEHFLYQETPRIVKSKIQKYLSSGVKPKISSEDKERFERITFQSDIMIYPDEKNLFLAKEIYAILTDAIAILAFVPNGIEIFGYRYEARLEFGN